VVDAENRDLVETVLENDRKGLLIDLVAGLEVDFTCRVVDDVFGEVVAVQIFVGRLQSLEALVSELTEQTRSQLFAGFDNDATNRARSYFTGYAPSSPSIALFRDGKLAYMLERSQIENRDALSIASELKGAFEKFCAPSAATRS